MRDPVGTQSRTRSGRRAVSIVCAVAAAIAAGIGTALVVEGGDGRFTVQGATGTSKPVDSSPTPPVDASALPRAEDLFVSPDSISAVWLRDHGEHPAADLIRSSIASKPAAQWFGWGNPDLVGAVERHVAAATKSDQVPVIVFGETDIAECTTSFTDAPAAATRYLTQVEALADGLGDARAVLVVQPYFVLNLPCIPSARERRLRLDSLRRALDILTVRAPRTLLYLDGDIGNSDWAAAAGYLDDAGLADVHGFVLNLLGTSPNTQVIAAAGEINEVLRTRYGYDKPYVIDTTMNGRPIRGDSCNSPDLRLGEAPRPGEPGEGPEYLLWLGNPGWSAGDCGIGRGSASGEFLPELAALMADGAP
ncbi:MAG: glycoside hydrolase family 6 protein [Nocardioides sp.]